MLIGYHGTSSRHSDSLKGGLKEVESEWDPDSGGELGPGFYVARSLGAAITYGYGIVAGELGTHGRKMIDVWKVQSDLKLEEMTSAPVPTDKTWGKITRELCTDYNWLYLENDPDGSDHPSQMKFNWNAVNLIYVVFHNSYTIEQADALI